jgi:F-type H+-transporting ATPase subunit a
MEIHVSIKPETLWSIGPLNITNSFLTMIIVMVAIILGGWLIARRASVSRPGKAQSIFEVSAEFVLNIVEATAGERVGRRIFPLVGGLFFFIILSNYSGLLPGVGTVGKYETEEPSESAALVAQAAHPASDVVIDTPAATEGEGAHKVLAPFFRSPSADLNMTLAMSLVTFLVVQVAGISAHGVAGRIKHMADPPFLFPIEVVSELSRIISLSFRLVGNIFAGEVLVTVMYSLSSAIIEKTKYIAFFTVVVPVVFLYLEVLFGFIQSLVFALLTLIYIALAAAGGHDDKEHGHEEAHAQTHAPVAAASSAGD